MREYEYVEKIRKEIHTLSVPERLSLASAVSTSIDFGRIRTFVSKDRSAQAWGVVWAGKNIDKKFDRNLPFFFVANFIYPGGKEVEFLKNGPLGKDYKTGWWNHRPYHPLNFTPTILTEPVNDGDKAYILEGLGVSREAIGQAQQNGSFEDLYRSAFEERKGDYEKFNEKYDGSAIFRGAIGTGIIMVCDQIELPGRKNGTLEPGKK